MPNEEVRKTQKLIMNLEKKEYLSAMVESALYIKATGHTTTEKKEVYKGEKLVETIYTTKEVEPDLNAVKLWLYNRMPEKWKEKVFEDEDGMRKLDIILAEITAMAESDE